MLLIFGGWLSNTKLIRTYFITGISLCVLLLLNLILYGTYGIDILFLIGIVCAFLYLFYHKYIYHIHDIFRRLVNLILIVFSLPVYAALIVLLIYCAANFPPGSSFDKKVTIGKIPQEEKDAFYRSLELHETFKAELDDHDGKIGISLNNAFMNNPYDTLTVNRALDKTKAIRNTLLNFYSQNILSIPEENYTIDGEIPKYGSLINAVKSDILELSSLYGKEDYTAAYKKYIRLWKIVDNLSLGSQGAAGIMINNVIVNSIFPGKLSIEQHCRISYENREELLEILTNIVKQTDANFVISLSVQAYVFNNILTDLKEKPQNPDNFEGLSQLIFDKRSFRWPFYDLNKTLQMNDDYNAEYIKFVSQPLYKIKDDFSGINSKIEIPEPSLIVNPVGSKMITYTLPKFTNLIIKKEILKSRLTALHYIIKSYNRKELEAPPIDNLTGKPFIVIADDDSLEIKSEYVPESTSEKVAHFKISRFLMGK
ncbi:hypothetical protein ACFL30_01080 [Candidatus Latescibacterota bacterium]